MLDQLFFSGWWSPWVILSTHKLFIITYAWMTLKSKFPAQASLLSFQFNVFKVHLFFLFWTIPSVSCLIWWHNHYSLKTEIWCYLWLFLPPTQLSILTVSPSPPSVVQWFLNKSFQFILAVITHFFCPDDRSCCFQTSSSQFMLHRGRRLISLSLNQGYTWFKPKAKSNPTHIQL